MNNKILLTALLLVASLTAFSTSWIVTNEGFTFSPANITVTIGDTIHFEIANMHDATEVSEVTWNDNGNTPLIGGFQTPFGGGVVIVADLTVGIHYYVCSPHSYLGMKGTINVQACPVPDLPSQISGESTACASSVNIYSVSPVSDATTYNWSLPDGWSGNSTTNSITATASDTGGEIIVSATNSCGTSEDQLLTVTVISVEATIDQLDDNALSANPSDATYQWINCSDNEIIEGETNQSFQPTINGDYAVVVSQAGCLDTSACYNIIFTGIEVAKDDESAFTLIYPNPSSGKFHVSITDEHFNTNMRIEIANLEGKVIYRSAIKRSNSEIDLSSQEKGIYFLNIYNGRSNFTKKIILR